MKARSVTRAGVRDLIVVFDETNERLRGGAGVPGLEVGQEAEVRALLGELERKGG